MKKLIPFLFLVAIGCTSVEPVSTCTSEIPETTWTSLDQTRLQSDIQAIDNYLSTNNLLTSAIKHPSGVRTVITQSGTGDNIPCTQNVISVTYTGKLLTNSTIFDSSPKPIAFILNNLINGWQIGFLEMNKGTKATIYIPSGLAYGSQSSTSIPANSNIYFEVELLDWR